MLEQLVPETLMAQSSGTEAYHPHLRTRHFLNNNIFIVNYFLSWVGSTCYKGQGGIKESRYLIRVQFHKKWFHTDLLLF